MQGARQGNTFDDKNIVNLVELTIGKLKEVQMSMSKGEKILQVLKSGGKVVVQLRRA